MAYDVWYCNQQGSTERCWVWEVKMVGVRVHRIESISRSIVFILFILGTPRDGRSSQWGSSLPVMRFSRAVEDVIVSAREDRPFESQQGKSESIGRWRPVVTLPG